MVYKLKHPFSVGPGLVLSLNSSGKADSAETGVLSHSVSGLSEVTGSSYPRPYDDINAYDRNTRSPHLKLSCVPEKKRGEAKFPISECIC